MNILYLRRGYNISCLGLKVDVKLIPGLGLKSNIKES